VVAGLLARSDGQGEAACLAWAASGRQAHKYRRVTMEEALRCTFTDPSLPAARETVATLDPASCR
jgi:hypothetical protein